MGLQVNRKLFGECCGVDFIEFGREETFFVDLIVDSKGGNFPTEEYKSLSLKSLNE